MSYPQIKRYGQTVELRNPIITRRYLWHVKPKEYPSDLRIARQGLLCPEGDAVYAHNGLRSFYTMYPYFVDMFDMWDLPMAGAQFLQYSYWRIDTHAMDNKWFVDPFMKRFVPFGANRRNYLCSPAPVPSKALRLYYFDLDIYLKEAVRMNFSDGVANVYGVLGDFDRLQEDVRMTDYIKWLRGSEKNLNKVIPY